MGVPPTEDRPRLPARAGAPVPCNIHVFLATSMSHRTTAFLTLLLLTACAKGGSEDRPLSEVQISASHHLLSFRGLPGLTATQVQPDEIFSGQGVLNLSDNSTYTITQTGGTSSPRNYALETTGVLTILVAPVDPRQSTPVFRGAYGLQGDTGLYFFTDRLISADSQSLGLFWGSRVHPGPTDLSGDWHLFSLHVVFSTSMVPDADNIARVVGGSVTVDPGNPGDPLVLTGDGSESTNLNIDLSGTIQDLGDGEVNLEVTYAQHALPATGDDRVFLAAHGTNAVVAVDLDESDGESGILVLIRKRTGTADPALLAGDFLIGGHTVFPNPTNPGSDAGLGVLSLTAGGAFRMEMTGSRNIDFTYQGTFTLDDDGLLTLAVAGTNETWLGAVDQDYNTVVIIDHVIEQRANDTPELNLFFALRANIDD